MSMAQVAESVKIVAETEGFDKATAQAQKFDGALDGVVKTADKVEKATVSLTGGYARLVRQIDPAQANTDRLARAQEIFSDRLKRGKIDLDEYNLRMSQAQAKWGQAPAALAGLTKAVNDNKNAFGLTGYQVQNLSFQLNDVITQLSLGQSVFRTMASQGGQVIQVLGQNENGLGGTLRGIRAGILGLGPAAFIGFGAVGLAGAAAYAISTIKGLRKEIEALEAPIRSFNTPEMAGRILGGARAASTGTNLATSDVQGLEQLAQRNASKLGLTNPTAFTRGAATLSQGLNATAEQSQKAISSLEQLLSLQVVTADQAVKFAKDFPQYANVIAAAFDTTADKLLDLDPAIMRTRAVLAQAIESVGKTATDRTNVNDFKKAVAEAVLEFDRLTGLTPAFDRFTSNAAQGFNNLADAIRRVREQGPGSILSSIMDQLRRHNNDFEDLRPRAPAVPYWPEGVVPLTGTRFPALPGVPDVPALSYRDFGQNAVDPDRMIRATIDPRAFDPLKDAVDKMALPPDTIDATRAVEAAVKQGEVSTREQFGRVITSYGAGVSVWRTKTDEAKNSTREGLSSVERAIRETAMGRATASGSNAIIDSSTAFDIEQALFAASAPTWKSNNSGRSMTFALPEGTTLAGNGFNGYKLVNTNTPMAQAIKAIQEGRDPVAALKGFGLLGGTTAGAAPLSAADLASTTSPISREIERLRDLQGAVMGRAYTPDPYSDKNPDYFYAGGSIFKAEQDKQFDALQDQIDKLDDIASLSAQLVNQNSNLPQMLVNALLAAGFGNIAAEIAAAITRSATSTTTTVSNPQTGFLPNRGETSRMISSSFFGRV